jgi:methylmalonyl-CoA/ethylmalonyl-CoA epimerase
MTLRLHHNGALVRDIPAATERYLAIGYEKRTDVIHDPVQKAHVLFLRLPGDAVYLELIAPDGPESHLNAALDKGGGLHHLCYATDDIDAECARLRKTGMSLIRSPVPAVAFGGRRIAWLMGRDRVLTELVEAGGPGDL